MICVSCGQETDARPCGACGDEPVLDGTWRLLERVGAGANGTVYRAEDIASGAQVAVKEMPFRVYDDARASGLVEREAKVLRQLQHPQIPRWRGEVVVGRGRARALFLVQDFVSGQSLRDGLADHRWTEPEVLDLMAEIAGVLDYLHALQPPVIHRDVKPGNLIRHSDGRLMLVDFGSVRDAIADAQLGGSSVAGTFGYMAPEQFRGHAEPATDL